MGRAIGIANAIGFRVGSKVNLFEPELVTYMDGLTTPLSSGQKTKLNTFIKALKVGLNINALSDAFDVIRVTANETAEAGLRNLVKRAHDATAINSPAFTALEGFTGNGTSSYIESNYTPSSQGVNFALNSASYGLYFRTMERGINKYNGAFNAANDSGVIIASANDSSLAMAVNGTNVALANSSFASGILIANRNNSTSLDVYVNKIKTTFSNSSVAFLDTGLIMLARRGFQNTISLFNTSQISIEFAGRSFSQTEMNIVVDTFEAYMDSNGKGVIA